jgi:hypothetical protein
MLATASADPTAAVEILAGVKVMPRPQARTVASVEATAPAILADAKLPLASVVIAIHSDIC